MAQVDDLGGGGGGGGGSVGGWEVAGGVAAIRRGRGWWAQERRGCGRLRTAPAQTPAVGRAPCTLYRWLTNTWQPL